MSESKGKSEFYLNESYRFWQLGKYDEAVHTITKAIELAPDKSIKYLERRVDYLREMGRFEEVIKDMTVIMEIEPYMEWHFSARGRAYLEIGNYESALEDYTAAVLLTQGENTTYLIARADIYLKMGKYELAMKDYNYSIEVEDNSSFLYFMRAKGLIEMDRIEEALKDCHKVLDIEGRTGAWKDGARLMIEKYSK